MNALFFAAIFFAFALSLQANDTKWVFDNSHTEIGFNVSHLVITDVPGRFKEFEGSIKTNGDNFDGASIEFTVKTASIDTDNSKRDEHLRSDDFFNAEKFPKMTFKSKSMKKTGNNKYKLTGDLTIRDVTKTVTLDVDFRGIVNDPWGNTKAGFKLTGKINRFDYNLKWNNAIETGALVVGKDVNIVANIQIMKQKSS